MHCACSNPCPCPKKVWRQGAISLDPGSVPLVGTIVERALQAWGNKKGLSLPHPVRVVLTLTWLVAIGPLFSIPWIQAGYPAQMLRLVRVDDVLVAAWAFMRWFCMGQGNVVREDL
eukprot:1144129-Pelagomonas_calceolata.AAC.6